MLVLHVYPIFLLCYKRKMILSHAIHVLSLQRTLLRRVPFKHGDSAPMFRDLLL